jgi:hypothetical protein
MESGGASARFSVSRRRVAERRIAFHNTPLARGDRHGFFAMEPKPGLGYFPSPGRRPAPALWEGNMSRRIALNVLICALASSTLPSAAADFGADFPRERAVLATQPPIYLGHFAGGRIYPLPSANKPYAVAWKEQYARFETYGACEYWLAGMTRAWSRLEGFKTCIRLR